MLTYQGILVTAGDQTCEVTSVPEDINTASIQDTGEEVSDKTTNITITKEDESTKYEIKISGGSLTEEEKGNMTDNMKNACSGKDVEKITIKSTTEREFEKMASGAVVPIDVPQSSGRKKRDQCSQIEVNL